ncbi:2-C-methyl-D-erythritol 2,4-cyclodiphosphate synthase [Pseudothermotoga thermarum]|uniref:2-C-methyl-D-erythritol 2,4-cyclodiphosphate synthase n=1 Tax=Pseudothermotoga thermarum DSM 5069 TaxID=688269 RepID=F7YVG2_9THEM|nr:2-C-methyl-D-erythritol 2,4-cyclodiphosphate synthase [Pseudothermotoga thermarum]AEH50470.1 2C-methyl-D-erythritol 2,4-cyclodiphosphate synthase [Pseudothermotoga thermarum DSM 5069]
MELRIGFGVDRHPFKEGRKLILAGVEVESSFGLDGHSDADVVCHALIDALLGATCLGDIGQHFPEETTPVGSSSIKMLEKISRLIEKLGWKIVNVDTTVICGKIKLSNLREKMVQSLAAALNVNEDQVSVKFKSGNNLGFEAKDGISCYAICLLSR